MNDGPYMVVVGEPGDLSRRRSLWGSSLSVWPHENIPGLTYICSRKYS